MPGSDMFEISDAEWLISAKYLLIQTTPNPGRDWCHLTGEFWRDWPAVQLPLDNWVARKNFWQMGLKYPTICLGIKTFTFSDQISAELAPKVLLKQIISCAVQICTWARQGPEIWMQQRKKRKVANGLWIRKRYSWVIVEFMPVGKTGKFMAGIEAYVLLQRNRDPNKAVQFIGNTYSPLICSCLVA